MRSRPRALRAASLLGLGALLAAGLAAGPATAVVPAAAPTPTQVVVAGDHNSEMGCAGDWQTDCAAAQLTLRDDGVFAGTFDLPAGTYHFKVAIDGTWDENYGAGGVPGGPDIAYTTDGGDVAFFYDPVTHHVSNTAIAPVATLAGSFQSELGCPGDWAPDCLRTWLEDPDGDGVFTFATSSLPTGSYEVKVAHGTSWDESYGEGGEAGGANIAFSASAGKQVVFSYELATHRLSIDVTDPPAAGTGQERAVWVDAGTVAWPADLLGGTDPSDASWGLYSSEEASLATSDGVVTDGGEPADGVGLAYDAAGLTKDQLERFPALAGYLALHPRDLSDDGARAALTGQLRVVQRSGSAVTAFTGVQVPGVLDDLYAGAARDRALGATWGAGGAGRGTASLALWAPTAQDVTLLRWAAGAGAGADAERVPAVRQEDGSWTVRKAGRAGDSYLWEVRVYAPTVDAVVTNRVTDPYSVALTTNATRSVLVDLSAPATRPAQWSSTPSPVVGRAVDRSIYELSVRDFSIGDTSVPEALRGTYGAFAVDGSGTEHLRALAAAGMNTVHLQPTFDFASVDEDRAAQETPGCDLASYGPASEEQQACVGAVAGDDGFNWGYDPVHYSVPDGSLAAHPEGAARVAEFRTMVGALHADGYQVVLDQVFNHTSASGQADASVLDRVVPGYYQRLDAAGTVQTATCCQDVATEHAMAEKLMVDSVVTWAKDYKVDGFRFDLMGFHSVANMEAVRDAVHALTAAKDGVDGSGIDVYGEGWNFGPVADDAYFPQARQGNLGGTGIGTFNDRLRDGVRGGSPVQADTFRQQGFGSGLSTDPNGDASNGSAAEAAALLGHDEDLVKVGLAGNLAGFAFTGSGGERVRGDEVDYGGQPAGYGEQPDESVAYVDAHDNQTLFDALAVKLPQATSMADRVRMQTLSLATATLSQSPSMWLAGSDLLRSKSLDQNSYDSGDWFNRVDWTGRTSTFGSGLPPAADNQVHWAVDAPLLADPALRPGAAATAAATAQAQDLLRLKASTPLFRLGTAARIEQKLTFPVAAHPGVIVMSIDDLVGEDVDPALDGVLVVLNASPDAVTETVPALAGRGFALSAVQAGGADPVVRSTGWETSSGTVSVPARTVAVLTQATAVVPDGPPAWTKGAVYTAGDEVTYQGAVYRAGWWTQETPGASPWGSWQEIAETGGVARWTASRVFEAGDVVTYDGHRYEARWWTRNQTPGASPWGPWTRL
ncbi:pullulanase-type alpha-1,6-glucosidase [Cellulomonas sp. PhB143]|uniref:pullulanase-type alpha-1,6-glucosidase n=1 Tax=Cellulomonas sp. PhB143 TaxID=2485186 RepID=UPI000F4A36AA|nr:pullulanase-type alpha-1,6-glucosidase [Cellulomonas sp. PhB143]ROS75350.1 pullulanase-type alpha-1,6-glucosidase [Cellulomonas sp. PhB143]